jgi:hypothetical protein
VDQRLRLPATAGPLTFSAGNSGADPTVAVNFGQTGPMTDSSRRSVLIALVLDLTVVVAFVVLGRRTHQESSAVAATAKTLAPFLMALVLAWVVARIDLAPARLRTGILVWAVTLVAGMFTRRVLFGEGIAPTFIVVTALLLGACFVGWRLVASKFVIRQPNLQV